MIKSGSWRFQLANVPLPPTVATLIVTDVAVEAVTVPSM